MNILLLLLLLLLLQLLLLLPSMKVQMDRTTRVVGTMCRWSWHDSAMEDAIALRKISPASCTCPIAKGSDEQ
jgi:hypothetical protein